DVAGPAIVNHYNSKPSAEISGGTAPGVSSGQAISLMGQICQKELPAGMSFEWTELTFQQIEAGKDLLTKLVFPLAVVFVFLVLAAQYESWSLPLAIILIVPMFLLAAIAGLWLALGVAVFSGMLGVTIFGIFFTPVFYVVIRWFSRQSAAAPGPVIRKDPGATPATVHGPIVITQIVDERAEAPVQIE